MVWRKGGAEASAFHASSAAHELVTVALNGRQLLCLAQGFPSPATRFFG